MTRFFQDNKGKISFLTNKIIEDIICIHWLDTESISETPDLIWLKTKGQEYWLRFFIDAGCVFGAKYNLAEFRDVYSEDLEDSYSYSFCHGYCLFDTVIISANVNSINTDGVKLSLLLKCDRIIEIYSNNLDEPTNIVLK